MDRQEILGRIAEKFLSGSADVKECFDCGRICSLAVRVCCKGFTPFGILRQHDPTTITVPFRGQWQYIFKKLAKLQVKEAALLP